jgi:hypothetical protein
MQGLLSADNIAYMMSLGGEALDLTLEWLRKPWVSNAVSLVGGLFQMAGGTAIVAATGWTGIGGVAGTVIAVQGAASFGAAFGNLVNLAAGVNPTILTSGIASLVTSSVQQLRGANNVSANNIAIAFDMGVDVLAGSVGVIQARNALGSSLAAIDDTATNHIANTTLISRYSVWDARVANPSAVAEVTTAVGVANTTTNSITSQIKYNRDQ